jgi:hypothetical protein
MAFSVTPHRIWRGAGLIKDQLIRSRSRTATPIDCVQPNICIRLIGLLGLEVSTKPRAIHFERSGLPLLSKADANFEGADLPANANKAGAINLGCFGLAF